uniref:Uncharacterized protein n=1 Tax=Tanacetum cinerariifolium TaxID=118510 RepID=A0A6L2JKP3_TANCI|nr:hypothetical protein [Tanacetum cinerariifolium]
MFEFKTKKLEESSSNWKPWHRDWDATTSNFQEDDVSNDGSKNRYNRKGFLEDDDARSDDSIFIVDPGWDDYCLQASKLNRPVPLCPDARGALKSQELLFLSERVLSNPRILKLLSNILKEVLELRLANENYEKMSFWRIVNPMGTCNVNGKV